MKLEKILKFKSSIIFGLIGVTFSGCSSNRIFYFENISKNNHEYIYKEKEVVKKIEEQNYTANFVIPKKIVKNKAFAKDSIFDFSESKRTPASLKSEKAKGLSNKELYFYNLWKQYGYLNKKLKNERVVNICPQFHNIINEKELSYHYFYQASSIENSLEFYNHVKNGLEDSSLLPGYPVLSLDYQKKKMLYLYLKEKKENISNESINEVIRLSLDSHYKIIEKEIGSLCDKGYSPNYYLYENLIQIIGQRTLSSEELVKAYLKIPIFANMYLIENMKNAGTNFTNLQIFSNLSHNTFNEFEKEAIRRVDGTIFIDFLYQTSILRHNSGNISLNKQK